MPAAQWRSEPGLIDQLLQEPYRFEFIQAVRVIERCLRQNGVPHNEVLSQFIRFENRLSVAFPASEIETLAAVADAPVHSGAAMLHALREKKFRHISMTPTFMGFLGSAGVMPLHYTERIAAHEYEQKDAGPRAFLDLLSTSSLAMYYQARTRHRPDCMVDADGDDSFLPMLLAIAGFEPRAVEDGAGENSAPDIADEIVGFYASQFSRRAVPACMIAGVLSEYFDVPMTLQQLVGNWETLPPDHRARLGLGNVSLDAGVLPGERIYRRDTRARLKIGPLDRDTFGRFLPGADAAHALERILGKFCGAGVAFEIRLVLRKQDVHGARLAPPGGPGDAQLGRDAFVLAGCSDVDREDVSYVLRP